MSQFPIREIQNLRLMLRPATRMAQIVSAFSARHTRDEVVEAIDAVRRHGRDSMACMHVNRVLMVQELGEPLINGQPQHLVATNMRPIGAIHARPDPMF